MKAKKIFMSLALFSVMSCFAFYFNENGIKWAWNNNFFIPVILILLGAIFAFLWKTGNNR